MWIFWWILANVVVTTNSAGCFISNLLQESHNSCNGAEKRKLTNNKSWPFKKSKKKETQDKHFQKAILAYQFVLQRSNKLKMLLPLLIFFPPLVIDPWMECLCGLLLLSRTNHTNQPHIIVSFVITFCSLQQPKWFGSQNLTWNNELAFLFLNKSSILLFSNTGVVLIGHKTINIPDIFSGEYYSEYNKVVLAFLTRPSSAFQSHSLVFVVLPSVCWSHDVSIQKEVNSNKFNGNYIFAHYCILCAWTCLLK